MKHLSKSLCAIAIFAIAACNSTTSNNSATDSAMSDSNMMRADTSSAMVNSARADISATKADTAGSATANFSMSGDKVQLKLTLDFKAKANQTVAVHFHEHGDCGEQGKGAHGHWNPTQENHGKWGSAAYHSGDIGNIALDANGKAEVTIESDRWTLGGDPKTNIIGKAIIVHSGVDDYTTQPTGNSGSRIGCGVIMAGN